MQFNLIQSSISLVAMLSTIDSILASPAPILAETANVNATLATRKGRSYCHVHNAANQSPRFDIFTEGWGNNDETSLSGCGGGLLDNLRGQCGWIFEWGCEEEHSSPHSTLYGFIVETDFGIGWVKATNYKCVRDAIWLASPGNNRETGVDCIEW
ncbi:hypothetical protein IFR05_006778 [Cadophora sp. M221]|nr:hypothetical protein IFR05_006778 [Cadophora sp. M221]